MVKNVSAELEDRKKRLIAFVVITVVFIFCVVALLYWAVNLAAARINSRITTHLQSSNPNNTSTMAHQGDPLVLNTYIKV